MDTLKPNMYVRTKEGKIFNCFASESMGKPVYYIKDSLTNGFIDYNEAYKVSPNIIDIVRVGDYVNGCYVSNKRASVNEHLGGHPKGIGIIKCNAYFNQGNYDDCKFVWIEEKDIKSIVTKEQFESMEYKID